MNNVQLFVAVANEKLKREFYTVDESVNGVREVESGKLVMQYYPETKIYHCIECEQSTHYSIHEAIDAVIKNTSNA